MALSPESKNSLEATIRNSLRNKFQGYKPESNNMPFHFRLLGKDRMALYSFIHSLNTTFGTSIFQPVAVTLARTQGLKPIPQYKPGNEISQGAQSAIQEIMNALSSASMDVNKTSEVEKIRAVCKEGKINKISTVKVDLFIQDKKESIFLFDLKTVKPNISNFKDFKRTLLEWCAIELYKNPSADVNTLIAIPYNPYEPEPYQRWTLKGMLDLDKELKVAREFWDFIGGHGAFEEILNCFERVGIELRPEIDTYFAKFKL